MLQKAFLHVSPSLTATIILLNFTKLMFETSLLPSVFFGLERGGGGVGRGVSTSLFGLNGYVPLNKVWFLGS